MTHQYWDYPDYLDDLSQQPDSPNVPKELIADPRFEAILGRAHCHELEFRLEEAKRLYKEGRLKAVLQERTQSCWNALKQARDSGMNLIEAQEVAYPNILLPEEKDDPLPSEAEM